MFNPKLGYLNINSVKTKFFQFSEFVKNDYDIIILAETKLDSSFPTDQFLMNSHKRPYRLDISKSSGGILVYINKNIASKQISSFKLPKDFQAVIFEINLNKNKWLIISTYNPYKKKWPSFS